MEATTPVPPGNLEPRTLFDFAVDDFETVWNALVSRDPKAPDAEVGANFLLAKHAVLLLELCCRVASDEGPGGPIRQFSEQLELEERRYFDELPCGIRPPRQFVFPSRPGVAQQRQLLTLVYDLIRNGQAHYYQQIPATLSDGSFFGISLSGADPGRPTFEECRKNPSYRERHLTLLEGRQNPWLVVRPEALFIDVMLAAQRSFLFSSTIPLKRFSRDLECSGEELRAALEAM